MIYLFDEVELLNEEFIDKSIALLSPDRKTKLQNLRNLKDKKMSVAAYLLLFYGLNRESSIPVEMVFNYGEYGKPYITNEDKLYFNLSHCRLGAVCAIADEEVGIDIEEITPINDLIVKKVCSEKEIRSIRDSKNPSTEFTKLWTMKESFVKSVGIGINEALDSINFEVITSKKSKRGSYCLLSNIFENYVITVCRTGKIDNTIEKISYKSLRDIIHLP